MIAPAFALAAVWLLATTVGPTADTSVNDLFVYRTYATSLIDGLLPYRDFPLEYPPLALAPIGAGALLGTGETAYAWTFGALMLVAALVVQREAALLARPHERVVAWSLVGLPVVAGAMVRTHFDLVAVALALAGLRLILADRGRTGFVLLALGTATKVFPALIAAAALVALWSSGRRRAAAGGAVAFGVALLVTCAPFVALSPAGFADQAAFHLQRPVQIESTPATVLWALGDSHVTGHPVRPDPFKSNGLDGGAAPGVAVAFALLGVAAIAGALAIARRDVFRGALAALIAFVALNKVLSPQYLLWLAPLAPVAFVRGRRAAALCVAGATVLTHVEFPSRYFELVGGDPGVIALVAARNLLLVGALGLALSPRAGAARARWTRHAVAARSG
jgi:hypothetical protein